MNKKRSAEIKLVITVALRKEVPQDWFTSRQVPVHTIDALKSGALGQLNISHRGVLVIITGAGLEASQNTAGWISKNLAPLFVLNIGTCGLADNRHPPGTWFSPQYAVNEEGKMVELDTRLPVPYPERMIPVHSLLSVKKPVTGTVPASWSKHDIIDMECYAQAQVFSQTQFQFHSLKFGTDYSDSNTVTDFNKNLELFRKHLKELFDFLTPPFILSDREQNGTCIPVTTVVPVYNRASTIGRALDSVLSQSCPVQEVIVVDDSSTDRTRTILESYENRITRIYLPKNSGPSKARNEGIRHAHTEWIAFLDSDDCWEKEKLRGQVEFLRKYPFYQILQSEEKWIRNGVRVNPCRHHEKPEGWIFEPSLERCLVSPSSVLAKKSLLEKHGLFDEGLPACEDYDLWLKISRHYPVGLDRTSTVFKYGGHTDQLSHKFPAMDRFRVQSLAALAEKESHPHFRQKIIHVLEKKLKILIAGYEKRGKDREADECYQIMKSIKEPSTV
jgi:GT2 family glycosyltransferase